MIPRLNHKTGEIELDYDRLCSNDATIATLVGIGLIVATSGAAAPAVAGAGAGAAGAAGAGAAGSLLPAVALSPGIGASLTALATPISAPLVTAGVGGSFLTFSNLFSGISALSSLAGGFRSAAGFREQARFSELQAEREAIAGIEEGNEIRRALVDQLAANIVGRGASGLDLQGFEEVQTALLEDAETQLDIVGRSAIFRSESKRLESATLKRRAGSAVMQGVAGAALAGSLIKKG